MTLIDIIGHLKASVPALQIVGGAAELDAAMAAGSPRAPAAFVIEESCAADDDALDDDLTATSVIAVYVLVRLAGDLSGKKIAEQMADLRTATVQALHGYAPPDALGPLRYQGGAMADFSPGALWWAERFTLNHVLI